MPCFYCWELIFCLISGFCGYHLMEKNAAGPWRIIYNDVRKAINSNCTIHAFCALKVPKTLVFLKCLNQVEIFFYFFLVIFFLTLLHVVCSATSLSCWLLATHGGETKHLPCLGSPGSASVRLLDSTCSSRTRACCSWVAQLTFAISFASSRASTKNLNI